MSVQAFRNRERNDDRFWIDRWQHDAGDAMLRKAVNQRTHSRIKIAPQSTPEDASAVPLLMDVSQRGACLWLHYSPQVQQYVSLRFRCGGNDHVLRSRVTWVRHYSAACDRINLPRADGWIAGITFADINIGDLPEEILRTGDVSVDLLGANDHPVEWKSNEDESAETTGVIALNDDSVDGIKAATRELVPVFAKHFSDVRMVVTRDRLEFSASFRLPKQSKPSQIQRQIHPAMTKEHANPVKASTSSKQPAAAAQPVRAKDSPTKKHQLIVIAVAVAAILAATHLGVSRQTADTTGATEPAMTAIQSVPGWAQGLALGGAYLDDWNEIKANFAFQDTTMQSVIQILQDNDIYPPAHDLHDLTRFPVQAGRAFSLLASAQAATDQAFDMAEFADELESRLMAGARFPDETPGGRYSSLQRELYHNLVVLGVVDLLYRNQDKPAVKEILAALQRNTYENPDSSLASSLQ